MFASSTSIIPPHSKQKINPAPMIRSYKENVLLFIYVHSHVHLRTASFSNWILLQFRLDVPKSMVPKTISVVISREIRLYQRHDNTGHPLHEWDKAVILSLVGQWVGQVCATYRPLRHGRTIYFWLLAVGESLAPNSKVNPWVLSASRLKNRSAWPRQEVPDGRFSVGNMFDIWFFLEVGSVLPTSR